jgi:outer membrane protein OmpA-like peptidoglycan-associated protein
MVFFDTDSVEITPQGAAMLDGFLTGYNAPPDCQVMIAGGADRAGSADYNLHLSRRRADAVADYLRRHGLAAPIMIEQHGETRPIVDTADGVADAQNRSVVVWVRNPPRAN